MPDGSCSEPMTGNSKPGIVARQASASKSQREEAPFALDRIIEADALLVLDQFENHPILPIETGIIHGMSIYFGEKDETLP